MFASWDCGLSFKIDTTGIRVPCSILIKDGLCERILYPPWTYTNYYILFGYDAAVLVNYDRTILSTNEIPALSFRFYSPDYTTSDNVHIPERMIEKTADMQGIMASACFGARGENCSSTNALGLKVERLSRSSRSICNYPPYGTNGPPIYVIPGTTGDLILFQFGSPALQQMEQVCGSFTNAFAAGPGDKVSVRLEPSYDDNSSSNLITLTAVLSETNGTAPAYGWMDPYSSIGSWSVETDPLTGAVIITNGVCRKTVGAPLRSLMLMPLAIPSGLNVFYDGSINIMALLLRGVTNNGGTYVLESKTDLASVGWTTEGNVVSSSSNTTNGVMSVSLDTYGRQISL